MKLYTKPLTKFNLLADFKNGKENKFFVFFAYLIALLPVVCILFNCIFWCFGIDYRSIPFNTLDTYYIPFPILFVISLAIYYLVKLFIDAFGQRKSKMQLDLDVVKFTKKYYEVWCLVLLLLLILIMPLISGGVQAYGFFGKIGGVTRYQVGIPCFIYFAICFFICFKIKDTKTRQNIIFLTIFSCFICCFISFLDPFRKSYFHSIGNMWSSIFTNSNHFSYFLSIAMGLIASQFCFCKDTKRSILWGILLAFISFCTFMADTLGALLAILITYICLPIVFKICGKKVTIKHFIPLIIFVAMSFIAIPLAKPFNSTYTNFAKQIANMFKEIFSIFKAPTSSSNEKAGTNRWGLWLEALQVIKNYTFTGNGDVIHKPHNEFLELASDFGIFALLSYLACLVIILIKAIKNRKKLSNFAIILLVSILCYVINSLFGNIMSNTFPFYLMLIAFCIREINNEENNLNTQGNIEKETNETENTI